MKKKTSWLVTLVLALAINAQATLITVPNGFGNGAAGPWVGQPGYNVGGADQQTMPNSYTGDAWDLEGFDLTGNTLSVIGTFNFRNGLDFQGHHITAGDIWLSSGGASWVIHANWNVGTYAVYANPNMAHAQMPSDILQAGYFVYNPRPNEHALYTGNFVYSVSNPWGFLDSGAAHNVAGFDVSFLPDGLVFDSRITISCGNDMIQGHALTPVPEPSTIFAGLLLGLPFMASTCRVFRSKKEVFRVG